LRENGLFSSPFSKKETFLMFYQSKKVFVGHIKVLGGPDVAQA